MDWPDELRELQEMNERMEDIMENGFQMGTVKLEDSAIGKQLAELQKLRQDFNQHVAEQSAYQAAEKHRLELAEKRQFRNCILSGVIGSAVGGLIVLAVQNWVSVVDFITSLFH